MRLKQLATILFLGIVAPAFAQTERNTTHLTSVVRTPIHSILPADSHGRFYLLAGAPPSLVSRRLDPNELGVGYDYMPFLGIAQHSGANAILISNDDSGFRGTEIDPETGLVDSNQPVWVQPPLGFRRTEDFAAGAGMRFFTRQDSENSTLSTFDITNGEELWSMSPGTVDASPDNELIRTSMDGHTVLLVHQVNYENRSEISTVMNLPTPHAARKRLAGEFITEAALAPDAMKLAYSYMGIANEEPVRPIKIRIAPAATIEPTLTIDDGFPYLRSLTFSPDGTKLGVLTGPDFRVYDVATGLRLDLIPITDGVGTAFAFSPDGTKVYLGSTTGQINLVDLILVPPMTEVIPDQQ